MSVNATTETPAAAACFLYRSCIFSTPFPAAMSAASDGRSACKTVVCEYSLAGPAIPAGKQKVDRRKTRKLSYGVLARIRLASRSGTGGRLTAGPTVTRVSPGRPRPDVMPADLGLSAGLPGSARPLRTSHASCEEAARPSPGDALVQLYDIKWPSARSSSVQLLFTYAAYQWARTARILLTAWRSKTGEATVVIGRRKGANAFRRKPRWGRDRGCRGRPRPGRPCADRQIRG